MARVLVLGAGGFVGRHLVAALAAEPDMQPIALVRGTAPPFPIGVEVRKADASDAMALDQALAGVEAAVNCIAGDEPSMVAATRNLVEAAEGAGIGRLVHLSSMAVYGPASGTVDEDHPMDAAGSAYARAKIACERALRTAGARGVILRPGCIHGPGSPQWTGRIGRLLWQHRIGDLGENGDGSCNLTFIGDMVRAIMASLRRPEAAGGIFNVSDPHPQSWNAYLIGLGRAIGAVPITRVSGRWLSVETKLLAPPLAISERVMDRLPLRATLPASITPSMARLWRQEITLDHRRADAALAFPRTPPDLAIAAGADWLRARDGGGSR